MALDPLRFLRPKPEAETVAPAPLAGTRPQRIQRVQIGLFGVAAMLALVALADVVGSRVQVTEDASVPEAAPTTAPSASPTARDPLAEAGVVPELPDDRPDEPSSGPQVDTIDDVPAPARR